MNEEINPTFTKLSALVFHAETQDDAQAARAELARMSGKLSAATARLEAWPSPPVRSAEGREVFHTYAASIDQDARKLVTSVGAGDTAASKRTLEHIAETCNNCHHFFRLKIEDSVVGPQR